MIFRTTILVSRDMEGGTFRRREGCRVESFICNEFVADNFKEFPHAHMKGKIEIRNHRFKGSVGVKLTYRTCLYSRRLKARWSTWDNVGTRPMYPALGRVFIEEANRPKKIYIRIIPV